MRDQYFAFAALNENLLACGLDVCIAERVARGWADNSEDVTRCVHGHCLIWSFSLFVIGALRHVDLHSSRHSSPCKHLC